MKNFEVELTGDSPLMHHRMTEEALYSLLGAKSKKKKDKEERTPREIAEQHAYKANDGTFYIPLSYVTSAFAYAASDYKQSSSSRKSYKTIACGIFQPNSENATLTDEKNKPLKDFEVDVRKGNNHQRGAVAVCRPRFDRWKTKFSVALDTDLINEATALSILQDAGKKAGIGSYRICKGGPFGKFSVTKFEKLT